MCVCVCVCVTLNNLKNLICNKTSTSHANIHSDKIFFKALFKVSSNLSAGRLDLK